MSENPPLTTDDVVAKLYRIEQHLASLVEEQKTANLLTFLTHARNAALTSDYKRTLPMVRERLGIPTDRNPRP